MAWFQHCHYYSLKQPPSILRRVRKNPVRIFRDFIFTSPRIEMEIPGGWGSYLFPSCLMLTSCPSLGKLLSFSSIQKAPINVDNSHGKVFEFRCYWKKYKKIKIKFLIINKHKFVMTWVIIIFFLLCAQVGFIRYIMKIFKLNTSDLHLLLQKADTWAYTKCGASMSGTQLLENFNYLPT